MQMCPVQQGPVVTPMSFMPPLLMQLAESMCKACDIATEEGRKQVPEVLAYLPESFVEAAALLGEEAYALEEHCLLADGKGHIAKRQALQEQLHKTKANGMRAVLSSPLFGMGI